MISQEEKPMTRINSSGATGPQQIPSQDSGTQRVGKSETQKTQQEPNATEQQQGKQAAQGRKNEMDLQGNLKQSELAQYGHLGGGGRLGDGDGQGQPADDGTVADAVSGAGEIVTRRKSEEDVQKELNQLVNEQANMFWEYDLDIKDRQQRAAKEIVDKYLPKEESNSSKKME
jgi:hypothetical protein